MINDKNFFSASEEVTDIDNAKQLIKESLNGFFVMFNNSPACMSLTNSRRVYVKVNKKFLEKFGYLETEIIGRTSIQLGILDDKESAKVGTLLKEKGRLQNDQVTCIAKNQTQVHTVSSIEAIDLNGEKYFLSSFLDITQIIQQQQLIEKQHAEILESINYARLIQNSIFPTQAHVQQIFPQSFVLAKPKNIVSGDFYWIKKVGAKVFVAACDCTGHGVPGALLSIIGFKLLSKFIGEYHFTNPADVLNQLNQEFMQNTKQIIHPGYEMKDGMDIALCTIDTETRIMEYAGAYNPIYLIQNNELTQLGVDKIPINLFSSYNQQKFSNHKVQLEKDSAIYLFSDGYADQFGGPNGKKFRYKNFQDLILSIHHLPMAEQGQIFDTTIEEWKKLSNQEQTDDILIVGFKL
jgi:PAS domain S-box-containing protein